MARSDEPNGVVNRLYIKEIMNKFEKYTYMHDNGTHLSFDDWKSYYVHYLTLL